MGGRRLGLRIAVVGAGISGLAIAWQLQKRLGSTGMQLTIFEAADRPGGCIWTQRIDGWNIELGPNGFLDGVDSTLKLCKDLGIAEELVRANPQAARRFVRVGDRLETLPGSPGSFLRSPILSWRGKARALLERFIRPKPDDDDDDESVLGFARRRFGTEAAEIIFDAIVTGIYAGDSEKLSFPACFPRLAAMERDSGSIIKGQAKAARHGSKLGALTVPATGMGRIVERLYEELADQVRLATAVQSVERTPAGHPSPHWLVRSADNPSRPFDAVVLACPSFVQAKLLENGDAHLARTIGEIEYTSAVVAVLGFHSKTMGNRCHGFGYLSPQRSGRPVLGVIYSSSIFPNQAPTGYFQFRAILGGWKRRDVVDWDDAKVVGAVRDDLRLLLGVDEPPVFAHVHRWPKAIPQYLVGHQDRIACIDKLASAHHGLFIAGNSFRGVSVNNCTQEAERLSEAIALAFQNSHSS